MAIWNLTQDRLLAHQPVYAVSMWNRLRGMIGRDFKGFDAMVFERCSSVHTCFMQIPLDLIFVDRENRIVRLCPSVKPWVPCIRASGARTVIEMAEGAIARRSPQLGDALDLNAESAKYQDVVPKIDLFSNTEPVIPYQSENP